MVRMLALCAVLVGCGVAMAAEEQEEEMPGANIGPRRFGADVSGGRGANGPVLASARPGEKPQARIQRQIEANQAGAASSVLAQQLAPRPWTVDPSTASQTTTTSTNRIYLARLKGITQDVDVESITTHAGCLDAVASQVGVGLYTYEAIAEGTIQLQLVAFRWFATDGASTFDHVLPMPGGRYRLLRDRVYVVGVVPVGVASGTTIGARLATGVHGAVRTTAQITAGADFPQTLTEDMRSTSSHLVIESHAGGQLFLSYANPVGGFGYIY